jgi:hypothetical protein
MIDGYEILSTIKGWLDNDTSVRGALGVVADTSKIMIGSALPDVTGMPIVMLPDIQLTPTNVGQGRIGGAIQFDIQVYAKTLADGAEDLEKLYDICGHIDSAMLNEKGIDGVSMRLYSIRLQISQPTTVDTTGLCRKILTYTANAMELA